MRGAQEIADLDGASGVAAAIAWIRLDLEAQDFASAAATLARHGERLIEAGLAPELWAVLRPVSHPLLTSWRFRVALEVGPGEWGALGSLPADADDLSDRLHWARIFLHRGEVATAGGAARELAVTDARLVAEAKLLLSRTLLDSGQLELAAALLGAIHVVESPMVARRLAIDEARIEAIMALAAGALPDAQSFARRAVELAHASRLQVREAESRQLLSEILLVSRHNALAAEEAGRLADLADRIGSPRFAGEARFLARAATGLDAETLLDIVASDCAPSATRRIRALVGDQPRLDHVDEQVVARLIAGWKWRAVRPSDSPSDSWWVIDRAGARVWFPDRGAVDLGQTPLLLRILDVLASNQGQATKALLQRDVWGVVDYDPARHDNRLKVAVRKLRATLETDAGHHRWIVTRHDGYALGGWPLVSWA